jgi:cobalt/nickel transport system permease protein
MVHISDGILSTEIWVSSLALTSVMLSYYLYKIKIEEIPKISLVASAVFVASLIHIPIGLSSVHLLFAGLAGIMLARSVFPAVFLAILLQAIIFQHGGITTIGVNTLTIGISAILSYHLFRIVINKTTSNKKYVLGGFVAGGSAIIIAVFFTSLFLIITGENLIGLTFALIISHIPVIVIETILTGSISGFIHKVKPEIISEANI